jgi:hypothetical protein
MSADREFSFRSVVPTLVFDAALPYLAYTLVKSQFPAVSEITALGASAVPPAAYGIYEIVRKGHIDIIGSIVLAGIIVSAAATFIGGDPKLVLIRESFVTGAVGVICLISLAWPWRPLMFYIGRQFTVGQDPEGIAYFDKIWRDRPGARQTFRILTVVWGIGWLGEFALRIVLVQLLTVPQMLAVGPIVFNGITFGLIAWTIAFSRYRRRLGEKADAEAAARAP